MQELPEEIRIGENRYKVRYDFQTWIDVERVLGDDNIPSTFKLMVMINQLDLFYSDRDISRERMDAVLEGILDFWRCGKPEKKGGRKTNDIAYDYDQDWGLIVAAFRQQYNINLNRSDMHWYEYKALFDGLTKETQFVKIVGYRTADLNKVPKEQRNEYRRLKREYGIRKDVERRSQKEIEQELLEKLR